MVLLLTQSSKWCDHTSGMFPGISPFLCERSFINCVPVSWNETYIICAIVGGCPFTICWGFIWRLLQKRQDAHHWSQHSDFDGGHTYISQYRCSVPQAIHWRTGRYEMTSSREVRSQDHHRTFTTESLERAATVKRWHSYFCGVDCCYEYFLCKTFNNHLCTCEYRSSIWLSLRITQTRCPLDDGYSTRLTE